jgi:hypothetical protein
MYNSVMNELFGNINLDYEHLFNRYLSLFSAQLGWVREYEPSVWGIIACLLSPSIFILRTTKPRWLKILARAAVLLSSGLLFALMFDDLDPSIQDLFAVTLIYAGTREVFGLIIDIVRSVAEGNSAYFSEPVKPTAFVLPTKYGQPSKGRLLRAVILIAVMLGIVFIGTLN